jgi:formylglycine-generating enzyme required for sulfatase activity
MFYLKFLTGFLLLFFANSVHARCPAGKTSDVKICADRVKDRAGCCSNRPKEGKGINAPRMVLFPASSFQLGSDNGDPDEQPVHTVELSRDFYMMRTEVTQRMYIQLIGKNPAWFTSCGGNCPVEEVSWVDAARYANALSKKEGYPECYKIKGETVSWPQGISCTGYRLPTEAEWEYAARGGGKSMDHPWGNTSASCHQAVLFEGGGQKRDGCGRKSTWPVCSKQRGNTPQGLCDMSGNVWEWVWDGYGPYPSEAVKDPRGDESSKYRSFRGGGWKALSDYMRTYGRFSDLPGMRNYLLGFRLVRTAK